MTFFIDGVLFRHGKCQHCQQLRNGLEKLREEKIQLKHLGKELVAVREDNKELRGINANLLCRIDELEYVFRLLKE